MPNHLNALVARIRHFHVERGAAMVEYALLVALIAIVALTALQLLGSNVSANFSTIDSTINGA